MLGKESRRQSGAEFLQGELQHRFSVPAEGTWQGDAWGLQGPLGWMGSQTSWCHCDLVFSLVSQHFWEAAR